MRSAATVAAKRVLHAAGHYRRALDARPLPGIAVLCYHAVLADDVDRDRVPFAPLHVGASEFASHCELLATLCQPLTMAEAMASWSGERAMPARAVLLTIDDGHQSLLAHALPALRRHRVPATVFACTGPIERGQSFWFDAVARSRGEAAVEWAKTLDHATWHTLCDEVAAPAAADDPVAPLTVNGLQALAADALVTIGAHTVSHPILARASRQVQRDEVVASLDTLAMWTSTRPQTFAYPNGRPGTDYTAESCAVLADTGIRAAFAVRDAFASAGEPALERSRFTVLHGTDAAELAHRLTYSWPRPA